MPAQRPGWRASPNTRARRVTDEMFFAAAGVLVDQVAAVELQHGRVFPSVARMREVAMAVSVAVAAVAHTPGRATHPRPADLAVEAARFMHVPQYA